MTSVNVRVDHLRGWGCPPEEVLSQIEALEAAGLQVNLQVQDPEGLQLLQQLPAVRAKQPPDKRHLLRLMALGLFAAGAAIVYGAAWFLPMV